MAAITWEDVTGLCNTPALCNVATSAQETILAYVNGDGINVAAFDGEDGMSTKLARIFLAAHYGTKIPVFGAVASQSADGVSQSYAVAPASVDALELTSYGRQYLSIVRRSANARFPLVMTGSPNRGGGFGWGGF